MLIDTLIIEKRYCGPDAVGNGGYVSGRLARHVPGHVEVTLLMPVPLGENLPVYRRVDGQVELTYREQVIARARPAQLTLAVPPAPSLAEARAAARRWSGQYSHPAPNCFVCGPDRQDGLQIFAGPVTGSPVVACPWTPAPALAGADGQVAGEFIWAALDCPGAFAISKTGVPYVLLGRLTARLESTVRPGEQLIASGWLIQEDGRKYHTGTALYRADGSVCAAAAGVWIRPRAAG